MGKGELNKLLGIEQLLHSFAERQEKQYRTRFLISGAKRFYTIQVGDIAYFYSLDKVTFAVTKDGKAHEVDLPLSKLEEQLDGRVFFRVNRQFILSADSIRNIQHYFNGKAVVSVWPAYEGTIQISRERMTLLKMWLNSWFFVFYKSVGISWKNAFAFELKRKDISDKTQVRFT